MKATLTFNLNDESDSSEYQNAMNGKKYSILLHDLLNQYLREKIKYSSEQYSEEYLKALSDVRTYIFNEIRELGINDESLWKIYSY